MGNHFAGIFGAGTNGRSMNPEPGSYRTLMESRNHRGWHRRSRICGLCGCRSVRNMSPCILLHHATPTMRPNKTPAFADGVA